MTTTTKLLPFRLRVIGLWLAHILSAEVGLLAAEKTKDPPMLDLEPLSLTILKDHGDALGQGKSPFNMFGSAPKSGTKLLVHVNPSAALKARLVNSGAKLGVFRDDKGRNLLTGDKEPKPRPSLFGPSNERLRVLPGRGDAGGSVGLELNAPKAPSPGATELFVSGTLLFAPDDVEKEEDGHAKVILKDGEIVNVGPVRLKFKTSGRGGRSWFVQMIAEKDVVSPTLMLFGEDVDRVIYDSQGGNSFRTMGGRPDKNDPFSGVIANGFNCPGDMLSRIKVRYYKRGELIEMPFELKTGLGLQGTP